jgi:RNA polymerase sigma-70 factor (ECF subfamily)
MNGLYGGNFWDLKKIYLDTSPLLFAVIKRMVKNAESAEDIMHDCYVKLQEQGERFSSMENAKFWLIAVARNMAINYTKRRRNKDEPFDEDSFPELSAGNPHKDLNEPPESLLNTLPPKFMASVILREVAFLPYRQISQILKTPESSVRGCLFKAKKYLLEEFIDHELLSAT